MITIQSGYAVVIDDEPANRDFLERLLQTAGFKVSGAGNGADGLKACRAVPQLALALVDQELPDAKGLEILLQLRKENPDSLLVMATMHDDRTLIDEAFATGVDVFLVKPHGFMELYRRLQGIDADTSQLRRVIIDQYGPRPYRGVTPKEAVPTTRPDEEVTRPAARVQAADVTSDDPTIPRPTVAASEAPTLPAAPTAAPANATPATYTPPKEQPPTTPFATPAAPASTPTTPSTAATPATAEPAKPAAEQPTNPASPTTATPAATTTNAASTPADKPAEAKPADTSAENADKESSTHTDVTIPRRPKDLNLDPKPM